MTGCWRRRTLEFARTNEIRLAAQRAQFELGESKALAAAAKARPRTQPRVTYREGDVVYVWRANENMKVRGWVGPGVVVTISANASSVWIAMRGVLLLNRSAEQVRPPTRRTSVRRWRACEAERRWPT